MSGGEFKRGNGEASCSTFDTSHIAPKALAKRRGWRAAKIHKTSCSREAGVVMRPSPNCLENVYMPHIVCSNRAKGQPDLAIASASSRCLASAGQAIGEP